MVVPSEFVMDASFAMPWIFSDEVSPLSEQAWRRLIDGEATAHVPGLWPMEMVNVTLRGPRHGKPKLTDEVAAAFFEVLYEMPLRVHGQGIDIFLKLAPALCRKHKLTVYDSAYLMLALTSRLPLATRDGRMRDAALAEGVAVIE